MVKLFSFSLRYFVTVMRKITNTYLSFYFNFLCFNIKEIASPGKWNETAI